MLGDHDDGEAAWSCRVLFEPAFHNELSVTFQSDEAGQGASAHFGVSLGSLWTHVWDIERGLKEGIEPGPPPPIYRGRGALDGERLAELRAAWRASLYDEPSEGNGRDGMRVSWWVGFEGQEVGSGSVRAGEEPEGGVLRLFLQALWRAAAWATEDPIVAERLEQLHGYLFDPLPWVDLGGTPRRVRLFGRVTSRDAAALDRAMAAIPAGEAVLVDLRTLDEVGEALCRCLVAFGARRGGVSWCAVEPAASRLRAAGVSADRIFAEVQEALEALARRDPGEGARRSI